MFLCSPAVTNLGQRGALQRIVVRIPRTTLTVSMTTATNPVPRAVYQRVELGTSAPITTRRRSTVGAALDAATVVGVVAVVPTFPTCSPSSRTSSWTTWTTRRKTSTNSTRSAVACFAVVAAVPVGGAGVGGEPGEQAGPGQRAGERPTGQVLDPPQTGVSILAASRVLASGEGGLAVHGDDRRSWASAPPRETVRIATMLIQARFADSIASGAVTLTFRRWKRPQVVAGNTYRTAAGRIVVDAVDVVDPDRITDADAKRAGFRVAGRAAGRAAGSERASDLSHPVPSRGRPRSACAARGDRRPLRRRRHRAPAPARTPRPRELARKLDGRRPRDHRRATGSARGRSRRELRSRDASLQGRRAQAEEPRAHLESRDRLPLVTAR